MSDNNSNQINENNNLGNVLQIIDESEESDLEEYQTMDKKGRKIILTEPDTDNILNKEF